MSRVEVRICGLGGQGVVLAGQILGRAAVYDAKNVVQTQSYGSEARGSAAKSEVIISTKKIGFPMVRKCDVLVAMSQSALDMYVKDLKENATLLVDKDLVEQIPEIKAQVHRLPATKIAETQLKSKMYANVVMLGALTKITNIVSKEAMEKAITASVRAGTAETNLYAFKKGIDL
ncbi:MAG: 2-oxoacid:acceptor oxidoreductase family protein [Candidatus Bathyarchaeota archaeon]|nr:2-oxoacid:acceptor oxidoreductase family protein [Candidatus Bathyarchaeota archaeon]MDH5494393.1 2-oxoacid:acceptor oxidoreductase family protein [Candidatus Bathyarchaeota archaeon]